MQFSASSSLKEMYVIVKFRIIVSACCVDIQQWQCIDPNIGE